jgi:carbamoylphosphate synthase small subunit
MKCGNRGHNIPRTEALSGRCCITSQNCGYEGSAETRPEGWKELFKIANGSSNEGVYCEDKPFSPPSSTPNPARDRATQSCSWMFPSKASRTAPRLAPRSPSSYMA